jgi:hypothetical protein
VLAEVAPGPPGRVGGGGSGASWNARQGVLAEVVPGPVGTRAGACCGTRAGACWWRWLRGAPPALAAPPRVSTHARPALTARDDVVVLDSMHDRGLGRCRAVRGPAAAAAGCRVAARRALPIPLPREKAAYYQRTFSCHCQTVVLCALLMDECESGGAPRKTDRAYIWILRERLDGGSRAGLCSSPWSRSEQTLVRAGLTTRAQGRVRAGLTRRSRGRVRAG